MDTQNRITSMIEERVRKDARPQADAIADAMHKRLEAELEVLGVSHHMTSMHKFVREVRDLYIERLVADRYSGLVDKLLAPVTEPMVMPPTIAEQVRKLIEREQAGLVDRLQRAGRI